MDIRVRILTSVDSGEIVDSCREIWIWTRTEHQLTARTIAVDTTTFCTREFEEFFRVSRGEIRHEQDRRGSVNGLLR